MFDIDERYYKDKPGTYILILIVGSVMGVSTVLFTFAMLWCVRTLLFG